MLSPGNSAEIAGNSAEFSGNSAEICRHFFDFIGASIQQSILPKLISNDGIPPKAVFKSEISKICRHPKSAKTSIHLELSGILPTHPRIS